KDIIIVKGQNIYPCDIEMVLRKHPKISQAAVLGIPNKMRGEIVGTAVVLKEGSAATEQEIKKFCLESLADYKVPKQIVFLDSLPLMEGGEIDKESIRRELPVLAPSPGVVIP
ncbi:MAG: hypothetical protein QF713_04890, partial [Dehalococcoidales bacterium]|nr:hypothetical protein [Dehalococcoidales bacterium]